MGVDVVFVTATGERSVLPASDAVRLIEERPDVAGVVVSPASGAPIMRTGLSLEAARELARGAAGGAR